MLHDAGRSLADLHLAEQDSSPPAPAADQHSNERSPPGIGTDPRCTAVADEPEYGGSAARRPPLHLVNARRRPSQGSAGRNTVNVYTRDGAPSTCPAL